MAIQSQPSRIPEPFAGSGTKNTIPATNATPSASQAASWASGFPPECSQPISAGGCPVPRNDVNGALNQLSQEYAFRQDGGIWEWSALADYDTQRMVRGSDGRIYWSVAQSGPGVAAGAQDPTTDNGTYWQAAPTDDAALVHKSGDETIYDHKTFLNETYCGAAYIIYHQVADIISNPTVAGNSYLMFNDKNQNTIAAVQSHPGNDNTSGMRLMVRKPGDSTTPNSGLPYLSFIVDVPNNLEVFRPYANTVYLGYTGSAKWAAVYSSTATIQTSDERLKSAPESIPDEVLDAWGEVGFVQFQFRDSIAKKGSSARLHSGLIAQRIEEAFAARGLDVRRYGLFCWDSWEARPEERDEQGNVVEDGCPAGDEFSLRYEEALCMEAAFQRRRADRAEARLAALEERLAAIEAKLNAQP